MQGSGTGKTCARRLGRRFPVLLPSAGRQVLEAGSRSHVRSLLAALLLRPNYPVPVDQLTAALWEQEPPARARGVIQGHVSRLRTLLISADAGAYGVELITQGTAYVLRMPKALLDAHRFEGLVAQARDQRGPAEAVTVYREALSLWRGPALAGVCPSPPLQAAVQALEELRLASVEQLAAGYAQLGEYARAAAVLRAAPGSGVGERRGRAVPVARRRPPAPCGAGQRA